VIEPYESSHGRDAVIIAAANRLRLDLRSPGRSTQRARAVIAAD